MTTTIPPTSIVGWKVIPDVSKLRVEYKREMGQQAGNYAADALPIDGWRCVFDLRDDGLTDGFVCEFTKPDGCVMSLSWNASQIRSVWPPKLTHAEIEAHEIEYMVNC